MPADLPPLTPGMFFHVYNRGNNGENLFPQQRNYAYFLKLWQKHIHPVAETWAFCLLKNHFHAAVYIRNKADLTGPSVPQQKEPSRYFSNFFNAYARGLNIALERTGALFERPFKRIPVQDEKYLLRLIIYIHQNPQKHGFVNDFREWKHSSYHDLLDGSAPWLEGDQVMRLFGNREGFVRLHQEIQPWDGFEG